MSKEKQLTAVVYCSSRGDLPEEVVNGTIEIIKSVSRRFGVLLYGGVNAGLMHIVASAAREAGMHVIGIVPEIFSHRADPVCHEIILADNLNDRKGRMISMGDIFIVLPGGVGTIDEWISTLSDIMVRERTDAGADRPILVWNHNGMYDGMATQLSATDASVYARGKRVDRSLLFPTASTLSEWIEEH